VPASAVPALTLVLILVARSAAATPPPIDYLHVAANEGSSAGGHTAIRFANETFHFQHHPGGVLRIHRDDSQRFLQYYSRLQNRTVRATHIRVSDETYERLRDTFVRHALAQESQFALHAALRHDVEVLDALAGGAVAPEAPPGALLVRGAGLFAPAGLPATDARAHDRVPYPAPPPDRAVTLIALRDRIAAEQGPDALAAARRAVDAAIARLAPIAGVRATAPAPEVLAVDGPTFSTAYVDFLATRVALDILAEATPVQPLSVRDSPHPALALTPTERATLRAFATRLASDLATLATSPRPDRGFALLVGMARLEALDRSVQSGRLVVLDAFPPDAPIFPAAELTDHRPVLVELLDEAGEQLAVQRGQLTVPLDEGGYASLEAAANRWLELQHATHAGGDLRVYGGRLLPSRPAWIGSLPRPAVTGHDLLAARAHATDAADRYWAQLAEAYRYNLVTHNCVSEIFATIDRATAGLPDADGPEATSVRLLGGHLSMPWPANFIPFVSADAVADTYRVDGTTVTVPYRQLRVDEMLEREPAWRVHLRESNTLTSTLYDGSDDDSTFVFFTDGAVWPRPVLGVVNLAAGAATAVAGLLAAPLDRGRLLRAGLHGVFFSAPELAFVNIRKGTFPYVPRAYRVDLPGSPSS